MSISDRLDEIESDAQACMEDRPADPNAVELAMKVPSVVAALRAVEEVTHEHRRRAPKTMQCDCLACQVWRAVEAALGEES